MEFKKLPSKPRVAVVGATGAVGREMLAVLERRQFPLSDIIPLASARSAGKKVAFKGTEYSIRELNHRSFENVDLALFSAGGSISKEYCPIAAQAGAIVVDNSSAFRMEPEVPLVVPEVNPHAIQAHKGIIANPNCSTIQMVVALKPLHDLFTIRKIVVATYQSVSGTGLKAMHELADQAKLWSSTGKAEMWAASPQGLKPEIYPCPIAFNVIPQIDVFHDLGYTKEEWKMINETHKILEDDSIAVNPTTVRVPVFRAHSESIYIETDRPVDLENIYARLDRSPGIKVIDDVNQSRYPTPLEAGGSDPVYVGRLRRDPFSDRAMSLWVVSDNLLKGAALNAVQIAELLLS